MAEPKDKRLKLENTENKNEEFEMTNSETAAVSDNSDKSSNSESKVLKFDV